MMHPPTRPSLVHAGAQLAEHLAEEPFAGIFSRRCPYAADLARLEWAMAEAFCAADAPALARDDLASADPSELRLEPVPSLRLLSSAWPVDRVREQFDGEPADRVWDGSPPLPAEPTGLRIWRRDERVRYRAIGQLEYEALGAAIAGEPFAAICERVARSVGAADAAPRAAELLARWTADGLFARPRLSA